MEEARGLMEGPLFSGLISSKRANIPGRSTSSGNEVLLQALGVKYLVSSHRIDCPFRCFQSHFILKLLRIPTNFGKNSCLKFQCLEY